jgi:hypothetical protein
MASTVRHNRARGKHSIAGMSSMVFSMLDAGRLDSEICNELGMDPEELLRLKHITGFGKLFADAKYSRAWKTKRQIQAESKVRAAKGANGGHFGQTDQEDAGSREEDSRPAQSRQPSRGSSFSRWHSCRYALRVDEGVFRFFRCGNARGRRGTATAVASIKRASLGERSVRTTTKRMKGLKLWKDRRGRHDHRISRLRLARSRMVSRTATPGRLPRAQNR